MIFISSRYRLLHGFGHWKQQYKPNYIFLYQQQSVQAKVVVKYCFSCTRHKERKLFPLRWRFSKTADQYDLFSVIINRRKRVSIIGENSVLIPENQWSMTQLVHKQGALCYMVHKETANQFDLLQIVTYPGASVIMWYTHLGRERRWTESNIASATKRQQSIASKPVWSAPDRQISWGHSSLPDTSCMLPPDLNSTQPCLFHFCKTCFLGTYSRARQKLHSFCNAGLGLLTRMPGFVSVCHLGYSLDSTASQRAQ